MMDEYKRANDTLHPTHSAVERAVKGEASRRKRKPLKALVPAGVAAVVAVALLITGLPGPDGGSSGGPLTGSAYAIALPEYPDLPKHPAEPLGGSDAEWEQFNADLDVYLDAWEAYQGETASLRDTPELTAALADYTGTSAALALAGEGNRVYSPVSLWFALAMLSETTDGETQQQILDALGASDVNQLREWADILWHTLYLDDGTAATLPGTSIWLSEKLDFHQDTLERLAEYYYAGSFRVPMGTGEADSAITEWVSEQTKGLIGSDGKVLTTRAETLAVLASTLYFQARWSDEFDPSLTEEDVFTAADGSESAVDFMHMTQTAGFLRQNGYQAASLGTSNGTMTFVLPDEGVTPADLLADPDFLTELTDSERKIYGEVQWSVPKFDVSSDLDLIPTLTGMGITDVLYRGTADFTPLVDLTPVWLEEARQIARVKVDEEGVEAAAVTLLAADASEAIVEDPAVCVMDLDRPFLFVIRDGDAVLFVGVVEQV